MGFFSFLFGSASNRYSQREHYLTEHDIRRLVSEVRIKILSQDEEHLVEETLIARRRGDGKISLRQIYEALQSLVNKRRISKYDRDALMKVFQEHYKRFTP